MKKSLPLFEVVVAVVVEVEVLVGGSPVAIVRQKIESLFIYIGIMHSLFRNSNNLKFTFVTYGRNDFEARSNNRTITVKLQSHGISS